MSLLSFFLLSLCKCLLYFDSYCHLLNSVTVRLYLGFPSMNCGLVVYLIYFPSFMYLLWLMYNIWKTLFHILCFYFKVVSEEKVNLILLFHLDRKQKASALLSYHIYFNVKLIHGAWLSILFYWYFLEWKKYIRSFITFQLSDLFLERYPDDRVFPNNNSLGITAIQKEFREIGRGIAHNFSAIKTKDKTIWPVPLSYNLLLSKLKETMIVYA